MVLLLLAALQAPPADDFKLQAIGVFRHPSNVVSIAITPDSATAFVALDDGMLQAYDLATRVPKGAAIRPGSFITRLVLNPKGDRLAVLETNGTIKLIDPAAMQLVAPLILPAAPERAVFSPDGALLFVTMANGHLARVQTSDLKITHDVFPTDGSRILALERSPDGNHVVTADRVATIKLWSASDLSPAGAWEKTHKSYPNSFLFDPSGARMLSGGEDGALKAWEFPSGRLLKENAEYHQEAIHAMAWGPNGTLVTGGQDGLCQFWDGASLESRGSYPNFRGFITSCGVSADGKWLVRGGSALDFVPMERPAEFTRVAEYGGAILALAVSKDPTRFVTGSMDRRLIHWHFQAGTRSKTLLMDDWVTALDYGDSIAAGLANGAVELHRPGLEQKTAGWKAHAGRVIGAAWTAGALATIGDDGRLAFWDPAGKALASHRFEAPPRSLAARGDRTAVGDAAGGVTLFKGIDAAPSKRWVGRPMSVTSLVFSIDGKTLYVGSFDGAIEAVDVETGAVSAQRKAEGASALSLDVHPTKGLLLAGFRDGQARLFDAVTLATDDAGLARMTRELFAVRFMLSETRFGGAGAAHHVNLRDMLGNVDAWRAKSRKP